MYTRFISKLCTITTSILIVACTSVKTSAIHQYQLTQFSAQHVNKKLPSIFIATPDASSSLQSEQMIYIKTPYELNTFSAHSWASSPASMLYPLILQSLQASHAFKGVVGAANLSQTDYRLDTQILTLQQNLLYKPSRLEWKIQAVLTHVANQQIVASRIFQGYIPCKIDTPYGAALAANKATMQFTQKLTSWIVVHAEN